MKNLAVIDIGTNSILLLIARWNDAGALEVIDQAFRVTRLGGSITGDLLISDTAMERSIAVLSEYRDLIRRSGVEAVHVIGTEMLRVAENSTVFSEKVQAGFGWPVRVISGAEEGRLTYIGAADGLVNPLQPALVADVGGGSTEIVRGSGPEVLAAVSIPLGVVRLAETMGTGGKISAAAHRKVSGIIGRMLRQHTDMLQAPDGTVLVGSGGTVTTVAAIKEKMKKYDPERLHGYELTPADLEAVYARINPLSMTRRRELPGMLPGREDVLLYGILICMALMEISGIRKMYATDRGLRFGYLKSIKQTGD